MPRVLESLGEIASDYAALVLDQWGVLHDGSAPYASAVSTLETLREGGHRLAVLSNSGRRAAANLELLQEIGFRPDLFDCVMTSGEALWRAFAVGEITHARVHAITRAAGDAEVWSAGLNLEFVPVDEAEAVLLMGLADDTTPGAHDAAFAVAHERGLPVLCSNPDRGAPRANGVTVVMPGTLAHQYASNGGPVLYFGKPHVPVFRAVEAALGLPPEKILMVGDSFEHDIAGAHAAGWHSVIICGGLHSERFQTGDVQDNVAAFSHALATPLPTYILGTLR